MIAFFRHKVVPTSRYHLNPIPGQRFFCTSQIIWTWAVDSARAGYFHFTLISGMQLGYAQLHWGKRYVSTTDPVFILKFDILFVNFSSVLTALSFIYLDYWGFPLNCVLPALVFLYVLGNFYILRVWIDKDVCSPTFSKFP